MGADLEISAEDKIRIFSDEGKLYKSLELVTEPYPGFPTDMQPQFTTLLALKAYGKSNIYETIYENRIHHVPELNKMGAKIRVVCGRRIIIDGPTKLRGSQVTARDIRGGSALVLAGLGAEGNTIVKGVEHIERGYESMHEKLQKLGAKIEIIEE